MTGAWIRIKRGDKFENVEIEHLTDEERRTVFKDDSRIIEWLNLVCNKLVETENFLDELADEGLIEIKYNTE